MTAPVPPKKVAAQTGLQNAVAQPQNPTGPTPQQPNQPVTFGQSPPPPPSGYQVPGARTQAINPQSDLRGQAILPGQSQATQQASQLAGQAAQNVAKTGYSPYSTYQQVAQPYQQAGASLFNQAAGQLGQQQQYGQQAAQAVQGTGYGNYGAIQPTLSGMQVGAGNVSAQQISGPTFSQGPLQLPGISTGPMSQLSNLAFNQDTSNVRDQLGQSLGNLSSAPDRQQLATQQFNLLQEQAQPLIAQQMRDLGKSTAAFGRMGSGLVNTQLADIGTAAAQSRDQQARQLALDAAGQTLNDRLGIVGAQQSGLGALSGLDITGTQIGNQNTKDQFQSGLQLDAAKNQTALDQGNFNLNRDSTINQQNYQTQAANAANQLQASGQNASNALQAGGLNAQIAQNLFGQQANNRDFSFGVDQAKNNLAFDKAGLFRGLGGDALSNASAASGLAGQAFGQGNTERNFLGDYQTNVNQNAFNQLGALSGYQGQQFGQDQTNANSLRGERDYQNQLSNQATQDAYQQLMAEQGIYNDQFGQNQQQISNLGNLGYGADPTGALTNQAGYYNQSGNDALGGVGNFLNQYAQAQAQKPGTYLQGAVDGGILNTTPKVR